MMPIATTEIAGTEAIETLKARRMEYQSSGEYPYLIGDSEDLERLEQSTEYDQRSPTDIIEQSRDIDLNQWVAQRCTQAVQEYGFDQANMLGQWPDEMFEKGANSLHIDILTGETKPQVHIGIATIEHPWHLPAVLKYGGWNDCPTAEFHCAFFRAWQEKFAAQITGMSNDVIECVVDNPPNDRQTAIDLAWQQYWYCADIVEQGCQSISNLAAALLDSNYWYFWWD